MSSENTGGDSSRKDKMPIGRTLHYFFQVLKRHKAATITTAILAILATLAQSILSPLALSQIIDRLATGDYQADHLWQDFTPLIALFIGALLATEIIYRVQLWIHWKMQLHAFRDLDLLCFDAIAAQSMRFHDNRFGGQIVNYTKRFVRAYETLHDNIIWYFIPLFTMTIVSIGVLAFLVPVYALILTIVASVFTTFIVIANRRSILLGQKESRADSEKSGRLADMITNVLTVKSYAREAAERSRFKQSTDKVFDIGTTLLKFTTVRHAVAGLVSVIMAAVIIIFAVGGNQWFGISIGTIILLYTYTNSILGRLWDLNGRIKDINQAFGDAVDMTNILDETPEVLDHSNVRLQVQKGTVSFNNITFTHDGQSTPIFQDFTLKIPAGQRVGLVGVSGSGKTTLTKLMLRFADVSSGDITIDGQDIRKVTQNSLREQVAYVPQESTLFHRSIADNISYHHPGGPHSAVVKAAKLAHADDFIDSFPKGYETLVGERGVKLSGGQRQRIAIARAILKDAPILLLDEATSALDSESEAAIQAALKNLMQGRTSLVIAHRLSTVMDLDRIIVLEDGKIIEDGSHDQLLKKGGHYAKLWSRQSGSFFANDAEA
ncbi:ABC transporter ATP-binding protein/permease [Candidatus Saccharibacteria bacterium]|nr:ABC transporter ATP-binding protein/permease [Candidatus Saccharibacteria bacterium]